MGDNTVPEDVCGEASSPVTLSVQSRGDAGEGMQEAYSDLELLLKEEATDLYSGVNTCMTI